MNPKSLYLSGILSTSYMIKLHLFIILYSIFCVKSHSQTIKGTVSDSIGTVPFATILLKNRNNTIKQYTSTNENGFYEIFLKDDAEILFLEVTNLTHEPKTILLNDYVTKNNEVIIDIKLSGRVTKLKEIIVEKKIPVVTKKDTLVFNPEHFKDGSEKVIEDLLKKLPGIKVEDNGEIKFKGKSIKKMLLDGDDLFDANYTIGSKNINVDMIDKVQGIENFEENSLLKGIRDSDEVALNLVLKKGKTDFSGNVTLGYGVENRYYGNLTGILVNSKIKGFGIASYNNVGQNNTPYDFDSQVLSLENLKNRNLNSQSLINEGNFNSEIDNSFHRLNNNFYTSLNFLNKVYKNSNLRLNFGYYDDKLQRINKSNSVIILENETFEVNETNNQIKTPQLYDLKVQFSNKEKKNFHWEYLGKLFYNKTKFNDSSINNTLLQNNTVDSENFNLNQFVNSTYKISENKALVTSLHHVSSKSPQTLLTNPGTTIDSFNNLIAFQQNSEFSKDYFNVNASYYLSKNKFKYGIHSSYFINENRLNSKLLDESYQLLNTDFINNNLYKITNFNINPVVVFNTEKYSLKLGINAIYNSVYFKETSSKEENNNIFFTPKIALKYRFNKKNSTTFSYDYNQMLPDEDKTFTGFVQTSYRGFISNELSLEYLKTHSYNLTYNYNDFFNLTQLSINLNHNYRPNNYFYNTIINQDITIFNRFYGNIGNKDYGLSISGETYFHPFRTTFQLNSNFNLSFDNNIINSSEIREIKNENLFLNFTARRGIKKIVVVENKTSFVNNNFTVIKENLKNNFQSLSNQTKIVLKKNERFNANVIGNFICPNLKVNNNYFFLESEINYTSKNKKITYSLIGKNLTNNKSFFMSSVTNFSNNTSSHNLIERYLMLKVTFGF